MRGRLRVVAAAFAGALVVAACAGSGENALVGSDSERQAAASPGDRASEIDPGRVGPQGRVAQFVVKCKVSHISNDDPIVLPWQPGKSHQHQFFGNTAVTSDPGYERAIGADTSCSQRLDTAAYWTPTLLDADGNQIDSVGIVAYYRPGDGVRPEDVIAYPPGFMMVASTGSADAPSGASVAAWSCGRGALRAAEPPECPARSTLRMIITFPDCWDGTRLTSFGSGAHVRYSDGGCPDTHPVAMPQLQLSVDFPPVDPDGLRLSSGPIASAHADFWNTWDQDKLEREVALCLNRDLVCGTSDGA